MSKAELARKAGLSTLTIDRVEAGRPCRLETKRKIILALGLRVSDKERLFGMAVRAADSLFLSLEDSRKDPSSSTNDADQERQVALPLQGRIREEEESR